MTRVIAAVLALFVASLSTSAVAQARRGSLPKPEAGAAWDRETRDLSRIVVKFVEGPVIRRSGDRWTGDPRLARADEVVAGARSITRLFDRPEEVLDAERAAVLAELPAGFDPPADLNHYFVVDAGDEARGAALVDRLNALDVVETAYPEWRGPIPPPGDIPPVTPDFSPGQGYLGAAPTGVDRAAARVIPGGRGDGLVAIDVEYGWWLDHEDVPTMVQANVTTTMSGSWREHGSAVLGELAGEWDEFGVTGIVDLCTVKMHSHQSAHTGAPINAAAAQVKAGDFILLEMQLSTPLGLGPVEYRQDVFDAIRNAVLAGKHVFEAAGNGGVNLDSPTLNGLFDRTVRDSGAVIIGASEGSSLLRANFSCYGSRIDACGWGRNVTTTGYGGLFRFGTDHRQDYTSTFSGTSSASPIVLGAAMALTGAVKTQLGTDLTPAALRSLLWQYGTDLPGQNIGKRPDLTKLLAGVGLPNALRLTDATIAQNMRVELELPSGTAYLIAAALGPGFVDLGPAGRWLLDGTALPAWVGVMPAAGSVAFDTTVPNDPTARGLSLYLQAIWLDAGGGWHLSSSARNYIW